MKKGIGGMAVLFSLLIIVLRWGELKSFLWAQTEESTPKLEVQLKERQLHEANASVEWRITSFGGGTYQLVIRNEGKEEILSKVKEGENREGTYLISIPDDEKGNIKLQFRLLDEGGEIKEEKTVEISFDRRAPVVLAKVDLVQGNMTEKGYGSRAVVSFQKTAGAFSLSEYLAARVFIEREEEKLPAVEKMICTEDGRYQIRVKGEWEDKQGKKVQLQFQNSESSFCVDNIKPKIQIVMDEKPFIRNETVRIEIFVSDKNMEQTGIVGKVLDKSGKIISCKQSEWHKEGEQYQSILTLEREGAYGELQLSCMDRAGNQEIKNYKLEYVIDRTPPTGCISTSSGVSWKCYQRKTDVQYFNQSETFCVTAEKGSAEESEIAAIEYGILPRQTISEDISEIVWHEYKKPIKIEKEGYFILYVRIHDVAGNEAVVSTGVVMIDRSAPIIALEKENYPDSKIYRDRITVRAKIKESQTDTNSGVKNIECYWYGVQDNKKKEFLSRTLTEGEHILNFSIPCGYSGTVFLTLKACDRASNQTIKTYQFSTDFSRPKIRVSYPGRRKEPKGYLRQSLKAEVEIEEKNFDEGQTKIFINGEKKNVAWGKEKRKGKQVYSASVSFLYDGQYRLRITTSDKAGNQAKSYTGQRFVIDKKNPKVRIWDGIKKRYRNQSYRAEISFEDANLDKNSIEQLSYQMHNGKKERLKLKWKKTDKGYRATYHITEEGVYELYFACMDFSKRKSNPVRVEAFTLDYTVPRISVSGIETQSNKKRIYPCVLIEDDYLWKERCSVSICKKQGNREIGKSIKVDDGKVVVKSDYFRKKENRDGVFVLRAKAFDRAGNTNEIEKEFTVNREGSLFFIKEEGAWADKSSFWGKSFRQIEKEIRIRETNLSGWRESGQLIITRDGKSVPSICAASVRRKREEGFVHEYVIQAKTFEEEGVYRVYVKSSDRAGNKNDSRQEKGEVIFAVDRTAPDIYVAGLKSNEVYSKREQKFEVFIKDNVGADCVVTCGDKKLSGKRRQGGLQFTLPESVRFQTVKIIAVDKAGNERQRVIENVLISESRVAHIKGMIWNNRMRIAGGILMLAGCGIFSVFAWRKKQPR